MLNIHLDRRGVALPLALLGLVVVSFLVTSAIVTSGAELVVSSTHQTATSALYEADGAVERYVGIKAAAAATSTDSLSPTLSQPELLDGFDMHVARLSSSTQTASGMMSQRQLYSVVARPHDGRGRSVGALVRTARDVKLFNLTVTSGLSVGGDVSITGTSTISDGRGTTCGVASQNAVEVSSGSTITQEGTSTVEGNQTVMDYTKEQMVERLLGGLTLQEAIAYASIKFGPGEYSQRSKSWDSSTGPRTREDKYNWGCPANSGLDCTTAAGNESNVAYYPMVAINANNGTVAIEGDHGQGVLIIYNGSVAIKGNMVYEGIIIVEQDLTIQGTSSGGGVKIEGAIVALGQNSSVEDNASGNATVVYNACINAKAQEEANDQRLAAAPQIFPNRTTNWFELVQ